MSQSLPQRIILVMGPTGAGKSTFINIATGHDGCTIGHGLESSTSDMQSISITSPNGNPVVFVDTPGFDDTNKSDMEILAIIAAWLVTGHKQGVKLAGILYLHRIVDPRMSGSAFKNLDVFKNLCGLKAMPNVVLVTTFWAKVTGDIGTRREEELKGTFWKEMLANGCETVRFDGGPDSAWDIINPLLSKEPTQTHLSEELVDERKPFSVTDAAIALKDALFRYAKCLLKFILRLGRTGGRGSTKLVAQDLTQQTQGVAEQESRARGKDGGDSAEGWKKKLYY